MRLERALRQTPFPNLSPSANWGAIIILSCAGVRPLSSSDIGRHATTEASSNSIRLISLADDQKAKQAITALLFVSMVCALDAAPMLNRF
ncbi:hypothetical protein [Bradyrhizobium embrapense]|uniref:hypothetical protein n=1 Tax=Bradyrhizobium embrapense TaxID=630921 RepID=UPI0012F4F65E|nr:hypothetical protein [Bradyrhizobium embrapense]